MINLRRVPILIFYFIFNLTLEAQSDHSQFSIRYYTSSKGLSNNSVLSLAVDYKGYLWIGTEDGLNRFDGKSFKIYRNKRGDRSSIGGNYIRCLYFDRDSTLWIGTSGGGLCRYDRKTDSFRNFVYVDKDSTSLSQMDVAVIFQDRAGIIWIGTDGGGLNKFNSAKCNFTRYSKLHSTNGGLSSGKILDISEDSKGRLIIASWDGGLIIFDKAKGNATHILSKSAGQNGLASNNLWRICGLGNDQFLVGLFNNGLQYFNSKTGVFKKIPFPDKDLKPSVFSIIHVNEKEIWLGTNAGIYYTNYHYVGDEFQIDLPLHKFNDLSSFQLVQDNNGLIWGVNFENGFLQIHPQNSLFHVHRLTYGNEDLLLSNKSIRSISESPNGEIILAAYQGTFLFDPVSERINYSDNISISNNLPNQVTDLHKDKDGKIWVARNFDMGKFNPQSGKIETYFRLPNDIFHSERNGYTVILPEGNGIFWLATENGLYYLEEKTKKVETIIDANSIYNGNNLYQVVSLDSDAENIYAGTHGGGFAVINKKTKALRIFQNELTNSNSITDNHINQVFVDKNDSIWIITYNGLDRFNKASNEFKHYNTGKFQDQYFKAIVEDFHGNLWISSNDGISKFNPSTGNVTNYYFYNQISQSSFQVRSVYRSNSGILYFGRRGTFISFDPDSILENPKPPRVLITDFKINNQSVKISSNSPLKENVEEAKRIELNHNESSFSLSFAATDLIYPERNQYAYKLENFENWVYSGNINTAIYTNIPPGKYTFRVMASNQDGIWNEQGTALQIWIRPPWWTIWVFRISLGVALIGLVWLLYYWNTRRIIKDRRRLKKLVELRTTELNEINILLYEQNEELGSQKEELLQHREELELQSLALKEVNLMLEEKRHEVEHQNQDLSLHRDNLEKLVRERTSELETAKYKAEESDRLKSAFLANMSHEIRTPLNAIVGFSYFFSDDKLDAISRERYYKIIKSNSDALLVLIDDILDLSRIEAGQLQFKIQPFNAREIMDELHEIFRKLIKPDVNFFIQPMQAGEQMYILSDPTRFKQILNNLLSNAFKFTETGTIQFGYLNPGNGLVTFYVKDTGIGIDSQKQDIIFERFMKIEENRSRLFSGTGLGLAISKRLTESLGGTIWVESEAGKGSVFYFTQPLSPTKPSSEPVLTFKSKQNFRLNKQFKIALAEDEDDNYNLMLEYLKNKSIEVAAFRNGLEICEYFEKLPRSDVQLILMDIKMPVMDGYEASRRIRKQFPGIPIIALTAFGLSNEVEKMQIEGFESILTKPVNFALLEKIIDKL
jgi:signal transduction histidine kinase/ligand-binding sensor domain-containing protein/CheY-like chemotaxis protein